MKNNLLIALTALVVSCSTKPREAEDKRTEITPFIVSQIILRDTTQERTDSGKVSAPKPEVLNTEWLSEKQFKQLESAVWILARDPKSKVYAHLTSAAPSTSQEVKNQIVYCDSIEESSFDAKGTEIVKSVFVCDSNSAVLNIRMIRFCESWYFNKETNMIEKELLGYSLLVYVPEKQAFKPLFYVYRDEEACKVARKNDFY